jgi:mRNA interferase MazF
MSDAQSYIQWINKKLKLNDHSIRNKAQLKNWKVNRGQIYTCFLGENIGFEKSKLEARPCIIVSTKRINHESGNIIIVPLSKNIKYEPGTHKLKYPYHYVLKKSNYPKLQFDSAVQCEDIRCVSKARLSKYVCNVRTDDMISIRKRLKTALQI